MGRSPSASVESHSREDLDIMLRFVIVLSLAMMVHGAPSGGHTGYGYQTQHCQTKYHTKYEQECHMEYDVVVDTTYAEECSPSAECGAAVPGCSPPDGEGGAPPGLQPGGGEGPLPGLRRLPRGRLSVPQHWLRTRLRSPLGLCSSLATLKAIITLPASVVLFISETKVNIWR